MNNNVNFDPLLATATTCAEREAARNVANSLEEFGVQAEIMAVKTGPVFTLLEVLPGPGVTARRFSALKNDLARRLCVASVEVIEHLSGTPYVGILIQNTHRQTVALSTVLNYLAAADPVSPLAIVPGVSLSGEPVVIDLQAVSHLLIGGMTGSGKSILLNAFLLCLLSRAAPETVRFILIAPRPVTFVGYAKLPHLLTDVIEDKQQALNALRWTGVEMERRFRLMSALGVNSLSTYNDRVERAERMGTPLADPFLTGEGTSASCLPTLTTLPFIVVVVDDVADLMLSAGNPLEETVLRLAQQAHAAGIHLILSTQRPSIDVLSSRIKAAIPSRIALTTAGKADSRTIIHRDGAEMLTGEGDMLFLCPNTSEALRLQCVSPSAQDIHTLVQFWKDRYPFQYLGGITSDPERLPAQDDVNDFGPVYDEAIRVVSVTRKASISQLQRALRTSYHQASRLIERLESAGLVSGPDHSGIRRVLMPEPQEQVMPVPREQEYCGQDAKASVSDSPDAVSEKRGALRWFTSWLRR
ncbi:DNA translocase FtsK [Erwinia sp. E602]|uniref:DNA translocase FtsK n=1 Tax=Erwinia sp. E602 TaxID=2675378 RepID=UPI001BAB8B84|nr:DNA translocase FtsK [Erwinia sp. E602]